MAVEKTTSPTAAPRRADAHAGPDGAVREVERDVAHAATRAVAVCDRAPAGECQQAAPLHLAAEERAVAAARAEVGLADDVALAQVPQREVGGGVRPRCAAVAARRPAPGLRSCARRSARARRTPGSTSPCTSAGKAVSSPITPLGAAGNGTSFSAGWCGAWSVAMQSIVPSSKPSMSASPVGLGGQRRAHLEARRVERQHLLVGQQQVVRRGLGRDVDAQAARAPHLLDRLLDVQVADVERAALVAGDARSRAIIVDSAMDG